MRPESTSVTLRRDLSIVAQEFDDRGAVKKLIAPYAAPVVRVEEASSTYPVMNREPFKKPVSTTRGEDGRYNRIVGVFGSASYACEDHGLEYPVDDRKAARYRTWLNAEMAGARILRWQILLAWERRVAALYAGAGFTNHNVGTAWSTVATANPVADIKAGADVLEDGCGCAREDLSLIIPRADFDELILTDQIRECVKYTFPGIQPAMLNAEQIATILGLKRVVVARSSYDSKEEGIAESMSQVWTAGVIYLALLAEPRNPGQAATYESLEIEPSAARTLLWPADGAEDIPVMESYREEAVRGNVIRARDDTDEVLTAEVDLMAYKLTNT